jgi:hypothetical protein
MATCWMASSAAGVRLVRPDGVQVVIESGMIVPPGTPHLPDLSTDRLLEIAQGITVTP